MANVVSHNSKENFQTLLRAANHTIIADEPIELGGQDMGMSPDSLLASALAACTTITLRMYINHKNILAEDISVEVNLEFDKSTQTTTYIRRIQIDGEFDEAVKKRLLAVANACPVHKMLSGTVNIQSEIV
ncbi:MAG: OsmC family protein [Chitinophagales bacterium]|nr:OsmC family protein [Chitinophagales bacterium]MCZ2393103.1 OsmC family protein [Chitinophagales bacterium]